MAKAKTAKPLFEQFDFNDVAPYGDMGSEHAAQSPATFDITSILPDPDQPRRLLPLDLNRRVGAGKLAPVLAVAEWGERAEADPNSQTARQYDDLCQLADSIRQHGLINPITIRLVDSRPAPYQIVTGERRYWAHILLLHQEQELTGGHPGQIKASLTGDGVSIRAHQLIENWHRLDIPVVDKARGLWSLRYDLSGVTEATADDAERLVSWQVVETSLGISRQHRVRLLKVLELPADALTLVEEHGLPERMLRPILHSLADQPDLQLVAVETLIAWVNEDDDRQVATSDVKRLVSQLLADNRMGDQSSDNSSASRSASGVRQLHTSVRGALKKFRTWTADAALRDQIKSDENREIRTELEELKDLLNVLLN